jgi:hypothetical protein
MTGAYVRFVCFQTVKRQKNRLGVFQAMHLAEEDEEAPDWALREIRDLEIWFTNKLATPGRFVTRGDRYRNRWNKDDAQTGLSWFKPEATDHIARMHRLKAALEACGMHVEVLTTRDPGKVVWEDEHQVVAEPGGRRF